MQKQSIKLLEFGSHDSKIASVAAQEATAADTFANNTKKRDKASTTLTDAIANGQLDSAVLIFYLYGQHDTALRRVSTPRSSLERNGHAIRLDKWLSSVDDLLRWCTASMF